MWIWILQRVGLATISRGGWIAIAAFMVIGSVASGYGGWKIATAIHKSDQLRLIEEHNKQRDELDKNYRERERNLIAQAQQREVVVNEVIKKVPVYIDRDSCNLLSNGVRDINKVLSGRLTQ
jgi:hypothetical protein